MRAAAIASSSVFAGNKAVRHSAGGLVRGDPAGEGFAFGKFQERRAEHELPILCPDRADLTSVLRVIVFFEELFRVDRGHAAGPGSGNGLAIAVILHVARDEDARNICNAPVPRPSDSRFHPYPACP